MKNDDAELVLDWFGDLEHRLVIFLKTVNYNNQNRNSVFPILANLIVDAGSIIDTIFREELALHSSKRSALTIKHYREYFEPRLKLSAGRVFLYQYPPQFIEPFASWASGNAHSLGWWTDYNELKHNRIAEYHRATLKNAVTTLAALFQVIAAINTFFETLLRRDMVDTNGLGISGPKLGLIEWVDDGKSLDTILIESNLFAYPRGRNRFPIELDKLKPAQFGRRRLVRFMGREYN